MAAPLIARSPVSNGLPAPPFRGFKFDLIVRPTSPPSTHAKAMIRMRRSGSNHCAYGAPPPASLSATPIGRSQWMIVFATPPDDG